MPVLPGATITDGCGANRWAMTSTPSGGRPITARSMSPLVSSLSTRLRLPSDSCTVTPGTAARKRAIMCGTMYFDVDTSPSRTRPPVSPLRSVIAWSASCSERSTRRA